MNTNKNVLVCPLDWGLGHATRCVTVIDAFLKAECNVIIAADGRPLAFLQKEFPALSFVNLRGYGISYQKKGNLGFKLIFIILKMIKSIYAEHKKLKDIIKAHNIDIVFSDNRYGLWNKKVKCIFMTHQLIIKSPVKSKIIEKVLFLINKTLIQPFDECWIPDFEGEENLSGDLSHKNKINIPAYFIGPLSRFKPIDSNPENLNNDILVLLSGPEPQRSIFEEIILKELEKQSLAAVIVRGVPEKDEFQIISNHIKIYSHLETEQMQILISQSDIIICRSGYSTIMDLAVFGKKAILIPTPGQTEQEYLAKYLSEKQYFYTVSQKEFKLNDAIAKSADYKGIQMRSNGEILYKRVLQVINESSIIKIGV
ncbi:MAG: glycosyltransferase [Bacteroidetes bacterium]|nr:glycosyltransferase [Bacteroidota bacterium]